MQRIDLLYPFLFLLIQFSDGKQSITLFMPHGVDESEDAYLCSAYRVRDWNGIEPVYIRNFNISSSNKLLHHMVIHACGHLNKQPGDVWPCKPEAACSQGGKTLYIWDMDEPMARIPRDVGFEVGNEYPFVVLQVHYAEEMERSSRSISASVQFSYTTKRPKYFGGLYILSAKDIELPPQLPMITGSVNCQLQDMPSPLTLFAFRPHQHMHGISVTGYLYSNETLFKISKGYSKNKQQFFPMKNEIVINNGDVLASQCIFSTSTEDQQVHIGPQASDEMCDLFYMYYSESSNLIKSNTCDQIENATIARQIEKLDIDG